MLHIDQVSNGILFLLTGASRVSVTVRCAWGRAGRTAWPAVTVTSYRTTPVCSPVARATTPLPPTTVESVSSKSCHC